MDKTPLLHVTSNRTPSLSFIVWSSSFKLYSFNKRVFFPVFSLQSFPSICPSFRHPCLRVYKHGEPLLCFLTFFPFLNFSLFSLLLLFPPPLVSRYMIAVLLLWLAHFCGVVVLLISTPSAHLSSPWYYCFYFGLKCLRSLWMWLLHCHSDFFYFLFLVTY